MSATKLSEDVLYYWHYMQKYKNSASLVGARYVLEVEMAKFLTEVQNPRVAKLLSEFIESEKKKFS